MRRKRETFDQRTQRIEREANAIMSAFVLHEHGLMAELLMGLNADDLRSVVVRMAATTDFFMSMIAYRVDGAETLDVLRTYLGQRSEVAE